MAQDGPKKKKRVSLKKAVAALETLVKELEETPDGEAFEPTQRKSVDGLRKQVEGMVLTMRGACQGRGGQEDFSFPGE